MTTEIKTNYVTTFPCLMKNDMNQIVLVTDTDDDEKLKNVTVVANTDDYKGGIGISWQSDLKNYTPLPAGFQITITN